MMYDPYLEEPVEDFDEEYCFYELCLMYHILEMDKRRCP
jgi:hypothetical protein